MGNSVNSTAFRLGINTFWKTELVNYKNFTLFKDFFFLLNFIKFAVRFSHWELLFFNLTKKQLNLNLSIIMFPWEVQLNLAKEQKELDERREKIPWYFQQNESLEYLMLLKPLLKNKYYITLDCHELGNGFSWKYYKAMSSQISYYQKKLKYHLDYCWRQHTKGLLSRLRRNYKLRYFRFLEDSVKAITTSLLFIKSEVLAYLLGMLIKTHKKVKWVVNKVRSCMGSFGMFYSHKISIRISICGKQKSVGRSRTYSFGFGQKWPMQSPSTRVSYKLVQTWNVFGAFGIKVWIFNFKNPNLIFKTWLDN